MQLYTYGEHLIRCFCKCFWILNHFCLISIQIYLFLLLFLQASICRSSQPLSGFSARCLEDEQMLQAIRKANPGSDFLYVVDTRPKVSILPFLPVKRLNLGWINDWLYFCSLLHLCKSTGKSGFIRNILTRNLAHVFLTLRVLFFTLSLSLFCS